MENSKTKSKKESQLSLDYKLKSPLFKIVLVGDSDVGKTSIIQTFIVNFYKKNKINIFLFKIENYQSRITAFQNKDLKSQLE